MIDLFISKFTETKVDYTKIDREYFVIPKRLNEIKQDLKPELIGLFLGKDSKTKFYPSLPLLDILAKTSKEKVIVKDIGEMDFIYGKNLRARHIERIEGENKPGFFKLVMNKKGECLGYGKLEKDNKVKNILDKGDYLRREKD